jgi:hypothetical protein
MVDSGMGADRLASVGQGITQLAKLVGVEGGTADGYGRSVHALCLFYSWTYVINRTLVGSEHVSAPISSKSCSGIDR